MLSFAAIASGSNGNCYFVGDGREAVLIDAGISCRETERRMARLGLSPANLNGVFISHEHTDHISGVTVLAKKYELPVYINEATLANSRLKLPVHLVRLLQPQLPVRFGNLSVQPFGKSHDAADPLSFVVSCNNFHVGVFTDIGYACSEVIHFLRTCHAVFIESNYCDQMLAESRYPMLLKRRISGKKGHLSNAETLQLLTQHAGEQLTHVIFSHLSANNNHPDRVSAVFAPLLQRFTTHIASRHQESPLFSLHTSALPLPVPPRAVKQIQLGF